MKSILNIGAGKLRPLFIENITESYFLVQLDQMYQYHDTMNTVEMLYEAWCSNDKKDNVVVKVNEDVFNFLGNYGFQFDHIASYRFLEHVAKPDVQGFLYLLSTALKIGGTVDIIVPNYKILADMLLNEKLDEDTKHADWERHDTQLTYELLNEPSMPHASIWTPQRIEYFFQLEERFKVENIVECFEFDGRSCYLRAKIIRIK